MRYNSPLRYPGGKAKLATFVKSVFRANHLLDGVYAEPYAGGAGLALALLFEEYAARVYLNDLDPAVYAFWYAVLHETDALCRLIHDTPATIPEWERQRRIYLRRTAESPLALGFAAFFLNRTNRSGIIDSARMIGGRAQDGRWKLDARFNRHELVSRVARVARYRDRIHLSNLDAAEFLVRATAELPRKSLIYLDPPYYVKGRRRLYASYYGEDDHAEIAAILPTLCCHWLVSYDGVPTIRRLYRRYRSVTYTLRYTAAEQQHGTEVMFFSPGLVMPSASRLRAEGRGCRSVRSTAWGLAGGA